MKKEKEKELVDSAEKSIVRRSRNKKRVLLEDSWEVQKAIEDDKSTHKDISNITGLTKHRISVVFEAHPEVYELYKKKRRVMIDTAADNIMKIVEDENHPKNYEASKFILSKYKSDLDNIFERHDEREKKISEKPAVNTQTAKLVFKKVDKENVG